MLRVCAASIASVLVPAAIAAPAALAAFMLAGAPAKAAELTADIQAVNEVEGEDPRILAETRFLLGRY